MVDRRADTKKTSSIANSLKEASPINIETIGGKTHATMEVGLIIRLVVAVAIATAGYTKFMFEQHEQGKEISTLRANLAVADSLLRKDFRISVTDLRKDVETGTVKSTTARETNIRETTTRIETEVATLTAAIGVNSTALESEIHSLEKSIQDVNRTTHAELKPLITNIENSLLQYIDAFGQRLDKIENLQTEQVKVGLFGRRKQ